MQTHLLVFAVSVGTAFGQISDPVPPTTGTWSSIHARQIQSRLRQPAPPFAGGFWVVEENVHRPSVIHYYTDQYHQLSADTLRYKHLNLKSRLTVLQLNRRLNALLDTQPASASVAVLRP